MKIDFVKDFVSVDSEIYVIFSQSKLLISVFKNQTYEMNEYGDRIFVYGNEPIVLNEHNKQIFPVSPILFEGENSFISEIENDIIYYYKKTLSGKIRGCLSRNKRFELSRNNVIKLFENYIFTYNSEFIFRFDFYHEELWRFDISTLGSIVSEETKNDSVKEMLGVAHGNLWFYTTGGRLIALDCKNGHIVFAIAGRKDEILDLYERTDGLGQCFFNTFSQNVISISSTNFQIIDTLNLKIIENFLFKETDPQGIGKYARVYSPLLQGDYFTFLAEMPGDTGGIRHAGIFDYNAKKLVWESEIISKEECQKNRNQLVAPNPLYISGDRLLIKDLKNTLHILQKT